MESNGYVMKRGTLGDIIGMIMRRVFLPSLDLHMYTLICKQNGSLCIVKQYPAF